jgi:hypothetical protein
VIICDAMCHGVGSFLVGCRTAIRTLAHAMCICLVGSPSILQLVEITVLSNL